MLGNRQIDDVQTRYSGRCLALCPDVGSGLLRFQERRRLHDKYKAANSNR